MQAPMPADTAPAAAPVIVDTDGAASLTGLSRSNLEKLRVAGSGPPFVKYGKAVRYRVADLNAWIEAHVVTSTSQPTAA
jgi:predicted DNA-binding transcriptional regulator AlpA